VKVEGSNRSRAVWGVLLIGAGVWFLLRQLDILDFDWRPVWPAIPIVIGVATIAAADKPKQVASGFAFILWGLWLFACNEHWYGLTYRTGWPLALVVVGLEMVLSAVLERMWPAKLKEEERHA